MGNRPQMNPWARAVAFGVLVFIIIFVVAFHEGPLKAALSALVGALFAYGIGVATLIQVINSIAQTVSSLRQTELMEHQAGREAERIAREIPQVVSKARSLFKSQLTFPVDEAYRNNLIVTVRNLGLGTAAAVRVTATRLSGESEIRELGALEPGTKRDVIFPLELDPSNQVLDSTLGRTIVVEHDLHTPAAGRYIINMIPNHPPRWDSGRTG